MFSVPNTTCFSVFFIISLILDISLLGSTALDLASGNGHPAIVEYLLDSGANVNARDNEGKFLLYIPYLRNIFGVDNTL